MYVAPEVFLIVSQEWFSITMTKTVLIDWPGVASPLDPLDPLEPLDPLDPLDPLEPLDPLDPLDPASSVAPAPSSVGAASLPHALNAAAPRPIPRIETTLRREGWRCF